MNAIQAITSTAMPSRQEQRRWYVTIDYKGGPSFSLTLSDPSRQNAIERALVDARLMGHTDPVRKATARPA
jgi:hypothetical protein